MDIFELLCENVVLYTSFCHEYSFFSSLSASTPDAATPIGEPSWQLEACCLPQHVRVQIIRVMPKEDQSKGVQTGSWWGKTRLGIYEYTKQDEQVVQDPQQRTHISDPVLTQTPCMLDKCIYCLQWKADLLLASKRPQVCKGQNKALHVSSLKIPYIFP